MSRGPKPAKSKIESKPPMARKSAKNDGSRVRDLEKRLAEALQRETKALEQFKTRDRELGEARDQQTATSEILRVIASSPTTLQQVLDAIAANAARVCGAYDATLLLREGDAVR